MCSPPVVVMYFTFIAVQHGSAYAVVRARMAKLGYQNFKTPESIVTKCGMGHYIGVTTQHAEVQTASVGASRQMGEKCHSRVVFSFFVTPVVARVPRLNRKTDFCAV